MKKFKVLMAAAMIVAMPALFTSCDDDPWYWYGDDEPWWYGYDDGGWGWNDNYYDNGGYYDDGGDDQGNSVLTEAEVLNGEWDGTMVYTNGDNGEQSEFYANMTFVRNSGNAIKGTGTEVDYTLDSNKQVADQQTLKFNWYINENTGDIYIHYLTSSGTTFVMDMSAKARGFYLSDEEGKFQGYMVGTNNKDMIYIDLNRVTNNEAKKSWTRSVVSSVPAFGSNSLINIKGGTNKLVNRR